MFWALTPTIYHVHRMSYGERESITSKDEDICRAAGDLSSFAELVRCSAFRVGHPPPSHHDIGLGRQLFLSYIRKKSSSQHMFAISVLNR